MKALATRYLNEMVGLTVMALMAVALIAGQADATVHQTVRHDSAAETSQLAASLEAVTESALIRAELELQLDLERLIDAATEENSRDAVRDLITIRLGRGGSSTE